MSATAKVDLSALEGMLSDASLRRVRLSMAERMRSGMEPFVPRDTGSLRSSAMVSADGVEYGMGYAADVYRAPEGRRWTTPGTGPEWDEAAAPSMMGGLERWVADEMTRGIA